jgi:hypothetical protein
MDPAKGIARASRNSFKVDNRDFPRVASRFVLSLRRTDPSPCDLHGGDVPVMGQNRDHDLIRPAPAQKSHIGEKVSIEIPSDC